MKKSLKDINEPDASDLENFHHPKVDSKSVLQSKIKKLLKSQTDAISIQVPNGLQFNTTFYVPKRLRCSQHIDSATHETYIAHYGAGPKSGVYVWSKEKGETKIRKQRRKLDCRITNFIHIPSSHLYFVSCNDLSLRIYNSQFHEHVRLQLNYSILSMINDERLNQIVIGCVGFVQIWQINTHLTDPPEMIQEVFVEDPASGVTPWISFLLNDAQNQRYIALSSDTIFFLDAITLDQLILFPNRHEPPLTSCLVCSRRQYLITGARNGSVKVWSSCVTSFPYVGEFSGHTKSIVSLAFHPSKEILITSSEDSSIRFWRMETFHETYRFDVLDSIKSCFIISSKKLCFSSKNGLHILDMNFVHSLFTLVGSRVTSISRIVSQANVNRLLVVSEDGSVSLVSPVHGHILTTVFPVVTHKAKHYTYDLMDEKIYILLDDGNALVVSTDTNPCRTIEFWKTERSDNMLTFIQVVNWNTKGSTISLVLGTHIDGRLTLLKGKGYNMNPIMLHYGYVTHIEPASVNSLEYFNFVSVSSESRITIWKLTGSSNRQVLCTLLEEIAIDHSPEHIATNHNTIAFVARNKIKFLQLVPKQSDDVTKKETSYYKFNIEMYTHTENESHKGYINGLTGNTGLRIFASSSTNNEVKIWSLNCILLREISFGNSLSSISFINARGDLIIGYQDNLYFISVVNYLPNQYLEILLRHDFDDDITEYCTPFDALLKFWYDKEWVDVISMLKTNFVKHKRRGAVQYAKLLPDFINVKSGSTSEICDYSSTSRKKKTVKDYFYDVLQMQKWESFKPKTAVTGSRPESPTTNAQLDHSESLLSSEKTESVEEYDGEEEFGEPVTEQSAEEVCHKKFWPCPPDGYIPNSVIRSFFAPKPRPEQPASIEFWHPKPVSHVPIIETFDKEITEDEQIVIADEEVKDDEEKEEEKGEEKGEWVEQEHGHTHEEAGYNLYWVKKRSKAKTEPNGVVKENNPLLTRSIRRSRMPERNSENMKSNSFESITDATSVTSPTHETPISTNFSTTSVLPPFDKYIKYAWFPKDTPMTPEELIPLLLGKLDPLNPIEVRDILQCIIDIHQQFGLSPDLMDFTITRVTILLEDKDGRNRNYAVKALVKLGEERKDIIIKLVKKLEDPNSTVVEEAKKALARLAGIKCADTLIAKLKEYDIYRETKTETNDLNVLEDIRDKIYSKREDLQKLLDRLDELGEQDARVTVLLKRISTSLEPIQRRTEMRTEDDKEADESTKLDMAGNKLQQTSSIQRFSRNMKQLDESDSRVTVMLKRISKSSESKDGGNELTTEGDEDEDELITIDMTRDELLQIYLNRRSSRETKMNDKQDGRVTVILKRISKSSGLNERGNELTTEGDKDEDEQITIDLTEDEVQEIISIQKKRKQLDKQNRRVSVLLKRMSISTEAKQGRRELGTERNREEGNVMKVDMEEGELQQTHSPRRSSRHIQLSIIHDWQSLMKPNPKPKKRTNKYYPSALTFKSIKPTESMESIGSMESIELMRSMEPNSSNVSLDLNSVSNVSKTICKNVHRRQNTQDNNEDRNQKIPDDRVYVNDSLVSMVKPDNNILKNHEEDRDIEVRACEHKAASTLENIGSRWNRRRNTINKAFYANSNKDIQEVIESVAPRLYRKFVSPVNVGKTIPKTDKLLITLTESREHQQNIQETIKISDQQTVKQDDRKEGLQALKTMQQKSKQESDNKDKDNRSDVIPHDEGSFSSRDVKFARPKEKTQANSAVKKEEIQELNQLLLSQACLALQSRRKQETIIADNTTSFYEPINETLLLMQLFKNTRMIDKGTVQNVMKRISQIKNKLSPREKHSNTEEGKNAKIIIRTTPYRHEMASGVMGERTVNQFSVLSESKTEKSNKEALHVKSMPERNGFHIVTKQEGDTNYGILYFHWSTLIPKYDMNGQCVEKMKSEIQKKSIRTAKNMPISARQTTGKGDTECPPGKIFSERTVLPKIDVSTRRLISTSKSLDNVAENDLCSIRFPAPPNTVSQC